MAFLSRGSARIFYEVYTPAAQSRAAVTLVNGHARSSTDFRAFAKFLTERGFTVLLFDNRGAGQTETGPFTFEEMVEDILGLLDSQNVSKTYLLGISYGGVICQNLAARFPNRVRALVLASTTAESRFLDSSRRLSELPLDVRQKEMSRYFGSAFTQKNPVLFKSLIKQMAGGFDDEDFVEKARMQRRALNEFDFSHLLSQIQCPTLVLHGLEDEVIAPDSARLLQKNIPGSELELWEGVGHLFLAEAPKRFYERVLKFFETH